MKGQWGDTIFAVGSGVGKSAIAVIRMSGPRVRFALETIAGTVPPSRMAVLRRLRRPSDGAVLDQALVLFFPAPASETGEDVAEFQVHGGRAVVAAVLGALANLPECRAAEPGEFARRALRNGKIDLLDVEALADLIDSETELQRRQAMEGGGLHLRHLAEEWRRQLIAIRAELEADLDFSDEGDVQAEFESQAERAVRLVLTGIDRVLADATRGERVRDGFRVVLAGAPNAGKSSLLNALAGRDVAIVSDIPGTTRDRIDVFLDLNGVPVRVTDTAGLQDTQDIVEREGIRRTHSAMAEADLVLWLVPAGETAFSAPAGAGAQAIVRTKQDLATGAEPTGESGVLARVSLRDPASVEALLGAIEARARGSLGADQPAIVTRQRQQRMLTDCRLALTRALAHQDAPELVAEDVRLACEALERLVGRIDVEDVLGAIFSRFCIGK